MQGEPATFWGKIRRTENGPCEWHPLFDHCADVGAVAEALFQLPLWRGRLARLAGRDVGEVGWARLAVLATLHDIGKLNIGFQAKGRPELGLTGGHVEETLAALQRSDVLGALGQLSSWGEGVTSLLIAAICHHGRPHTIQSAAARWQASWWRPRQGLDPEGGCVALLERCRRWHPRAFEDGAPLPDCPAFTHAFAGVVMLADWIGSDTRFFPFSDIDDDRMPFARAAAGRAIAAMGIDVPPPTRCDAAGRNAFHRIAPPGYTPRPTQEAMLSLSHDGSGSITFLEAETGSGKTEAALARFVELFEAGLVDGLYFALPTRSAATQIHARVVEAARRAFADPPGVVLAVPGYLRVDDVQGERLPPFEVLWPDHERFRYRAWAAENPKRFLVGCIVIGTVDQVLLSSLMVGHAHLRASALLRHLLVVDEVHASDAYMERILQHVLARHLAAGGHALLLSATLGGEARARLLRPGETAAVPDLAGAVETPYPLITHRSTDTQLTAIRSAGRTRIVRMAHEPWLERPSAIAEHALSAATLGARALIIKNTVGDCIATQQQVERVAEACGRRDLLFSCAGVPAPHHARFARLDRALLDTALDQALGRDRRGGGFVVVATQTVQQSLDIDADVLFTDLCPADVLLQRIGRVHRHDRKRPAGFEAARAVVAVPAERDLGRLIADSGLARNHHGLGSVYPDLRIIEATWRLLEEYAEWSLPYMNRLLVERSLHSTVLGEIVRHAGPPWRSHAIQMAGAERGQARQADLNVIDWCRSYAEMSFPNSTDQRIATRLGEGDRVVRFVPPASGPFGTDVTELVLPATWVVGLDTEDDIAANVVVRENATRFEVAAQAFVYDRLGLRRAAAASREATHDDAV